MKSSKCKRRDTTPLGLIVRSLSDTQATFLPVSHYPVASC